MLKKKVKSGTLWKKILSSIWVFTRQRVGLSFLAKYRDQTVEIFSQTHIYKPPPPLKHTYMKKRSISKKKSLGRELQHLPLQCVRQCMQSLLRNIIKKLLTSLMTPFISHFTQINFFLKTIDWSRYFVKHTALSSKNIIVIWLEAWLTG